MYVEYKLIYLTRRLRNANEINMLLCFAWNGETIAPQAGFEPPGRKADRDLAPPSDPNKKDKPDSLPNTLAPQAGFEPTTL